MSVTFTVKNDTDKSVIEHITCDCLGQDDDCKYCGGTGDLPETHAESKFQLNVANLSFTLLAKSLGIPLQMYGEINPYVIIERLEGEINQDVLKMKTNDRLMGMWAPSIDENKKRMERYYSSLNSIVQQAIKLNENVLWF
ncbi:MAG: hypothetical protein HRT88_08535 [Lentisphaeraceae bacterium]|nr:hypothetical protein [Lentisphaeraceae bacterium]